MAAIQWRPVLNALTKPVSYRIQIVPRGFSLIDMKDGGASGAQIPVTQNETYTLPGFAGSAVSSLEIRVDHYLALWSMIRNDYQGRLVDILDVAV